MAILYVGGPQDNPAHESSDEEGDQNREGAAAAARRNSGEERSQSQARHERATEDTATSSRAHMEEPSTDCSTAQNWQQVSEITVGYWQVNIA